MKIICVTDFRKNTSSFINEVGCVVRAIDALHVACAIEWKADLFVTSDRRQLIAAQKAGFRTEYLGQPVNSTDSKDRIAD